MECSQITTLWQSSGPQGVRKKPRRRSPELPGVRQGQGSRQGDDDTEHSRPSVANGGGPHTDRFWTFTLVTDGIETALEQARRAARGKDVIIGGGADAINQYLVAGRVDEIELHVVPILLGGGARLFEGVGPGLRLEQLSAVDAPGVAHLKYRVVK